jgi:hypothetical protein
MPNVLAPRNTTSKHTTDKINIWRQKGLTQEEFNMDVTVFADLLGITPTESIDLNEIQIIPTGYNTIGTFVSNDCDGYTLNKGDIVSVTRLGNTLAYIYNPRFPNGQNNTSNYTILGYYTNGGYTNFSKITDDYEVFGTIGISGDTTVRIKYKVGDGRSYSVDVFDAAPAHVYFMEFTDVVENVYIDKVFSGDWTIDKFYNKDNAVVVALAGAVRGDYIIYHDIDYGTPVYVSSSSPDMIDITTTPITFTYTGDIGAIQPTGDSWRIITLKGYYIKDITG